MTKKRFGSSSFLFLTAVLGMAGSAAASAAENSGERKVTAEDGSLVKNDLDNLENKFNDALNDTKSLKAQQAIKNLMDAQLENLRTKEKLTQYDVEGKSFCRLFLSVLVKVNRVKQK